MKNFVEAKWLKENIENVVVIDVRYDLHNPDYGLSVYEKGHIPGAHYLHIDMDLAGKKKTHGGSRPVPEIDEFVPKIEKLGISNDTTVVIYDESMVTAGRTFWMFRYLGHDKVVILNGGYKSWLDSGYPVTEVIPEKKTGITFKANVREELYCDIKYVEDHKDKPEVALVECRSYERYLGRNEPFYSRPGHIPGAICIDSKSLLDENLKIKSIAELENIFRKIDKKKEIIFNCGSGINASLVFAVLDELGRKEKIYIGGYSDWISYDDKPVETKDEH